MEAEASNPLIFPLDVSPRELSKWLGLLKDWVWGFKVGKELFTEGGPQ
ncbi:MAG: orotidine-5'-phosphate decarboxylase, partial [Deltaproteobacteria bacterium]